MGVEVLCRIEVLPRVGVTHGCLLVTRGGLDLAILEYAEYAKNSHLKQAKLGTLEYPEVNQAITV